MSTVQVFYVMREAAPSQTLSPSERAEMSMPGYVPVRKANRDEIGKFFSRAAADEHISKQDTSARYVVDERTEPMAVQHPAHHGDEAGGVAAAWHQPPPKRGG